jgi:hypothetical protein
MPNKVLSLIIAGLLLTSCGGDEKSSSKSGTEPPNTARTPVMPASTSFAIQQTPTGVDAAAEPTAAPILDPGPYFTPQRNAPTGRPENFSPPIVVDKFILMRARGNCAQASGQINEYTHENQEIIYLTCQYTGSATSATNYISQLPAVFNAEPIQLKIQGNQSFGLMPAGKGFVYAWTHDAWYFTARSLNGRELLDEFMQNFPY